MVHLVAHPKLVVSALITCHIVCMLLQKKTKQPFIENLSVAY